MTLLLLRIGHRYGTGILELLWGLWLLPFGALVYQSGFMPYWLGVLLVLGGVAYVIESGTFLLFPAFDGLVTTYTLLGYSMARFGGCNQIQSKRTSALLWFFFERSCQKYQNLVLLGKVIVIR